MARAAIGGGNAHTCALRADGTVWCWGKNNAGQLGNRANTDSPVPVQAFGLTDAVELSLGQDSSCARRSAGNIVCWGDNAGYGAASGISWNPRPKTGL